MARYEITHYGLEATLGRLLGAMRKADKLGAIVTSGTVDYSRQITYEHGRISVVLGGNIWVRVDNHNVLMARVSPSDRPPRVSALVLLDKFHDLDPDVLIGPLERIADMLDRQVALAQEQAALAEKRAADAKEAARRALVRDVTAYLADV